MIDTKQMNGGYNSVAYMLSPATGKLKDKKDKKATLI